MSKVIDLTGQIFGNWKVISRGEGYHGKARWNCECLSCHKIYLREGGSLRRGTSTQCNSCKSQKEKNSTFIDETGKRYGKLTVKKLAYFKNNKAYWECECDCGNTKEVMGKLLRNKHVQSCGCLTISGGELSIQKILDENNINYLFDKEYFKDLVLPSGALGRYDFILIHENKPYRIIEFDGKQHFKEVNFFDKNKGLEYRQECDKIKNDYALNHNIPLVRIPYWERDNLTLELIMSNKYLIKNEAE